ncbi:BREX system ATP-binding domain-containing protein [Nonomuraea sp. NPDC049480]|uniref:helix-turn-helix transcriptional regulator n=1 Tax=Nonomuraea sp. NPDC049480 TaxID=3364353 RepID=UPI00378842A6
MTQKLRGREAEERQIVRMLHTVAAGGSAVLHVEGGWGSGRTRLLREAADAAGRLGFTVLDADWSPGAEPGALVGPRASRGPVLVVLDDLHHADPAFAGSLRSLPWRLRDRPIAWVLSRRRHAGGPAADRLFSRPHPAGGRLDLRPLSAQAVGLLVADHSTGAAIGLPDLLRATGGNPLLTVELAQSVHGEAPDGIIDRPPYRVQACVRRCVTELSDACRRFLQVGAVLGVRFALGDVTKMLRRPAADLLTPVEEALAADILACDGDRLVFSQELFWRCVLASLPHPARTALEQEAAVEQLTLAAFDHVGTHRDAAHVEERPAIRLAGPVRQPSGWAELSDTERTVAHLVSQGLTNQQIASRVFRSPHTVNYHLRRIFQKLSIRSRVELARVTLLHYSAGRAPAEDVMDAAG